MKQFLKWLLTEKPVVPGSIEDRMKKRVIHYRGMTVFCF